MKVDCPHCGTTVLRIGEECPACCSRFDDPVTAGSAELKRRTQSENVARQAAGETRFTSARLQRSVVAVFVLIVVAVGLGFALPSEAGVPTGLVIAVIGMGLGLRILYVLALAVERDDEQ